MAKFSELVNCRIQFKTSDGAYEGDLKTVGNSAERMIVHNCVFLSDSTYVGTLFLSFKEVYDVDRVSLSEWRENPCPSSLKKRSILQAKAGAKSLETSTEEFAISPLFSHLPSKVITISTYGDVLKQAIDDLKMSSVIGVALEGPMIGRYGIINWLCASSEKGTYIFDLLALGSKVFDHGLRKILESSSIQKVIHDCRPVSDALFHLFGTKLKRVYDTQTAEAFVSLQMDRKDFHGYVKSLDSCLQRYLDIAEDYLPQPDENIPYPLKVKSSFLRPLGHFAMSIMIKNVIYLISLQDKLTQMVLKPFYGAVGTFLNAVAPKSDLELKRNPHESTRIPPALVLEDKFCAVRYKETPHVPLNETFNLPYTGEYSFINKLNELRKQNPHASAHDIHARLPKVRLRRGPCYYPEPVSVLDIDYSSSSGMRSNHTANELPSKSRTSNVGDFVPEKNRSLPGEKSRVVKTETSKHSSSSEKKNIVTKAEPSKSPSTVGSFEEREASPEAKVVNSRSKNLIAVLKAFNELKTKAETSKSPSMVGSFEQKDTTADAKVLTKSLTSLPLKNKENHPVERIPFQLKHFPETLSTPNCKKESERVLDSCAEPEYKARDCDAVSFDSDGTFCYLPAKPSSWDSDNPWASFKSKYYLEESVGCNLGYKPKFVPAGRE